MAGCLLAVVVIATMPVVLVLATFAAVIYWTAHYEAEARRAGLLIEEHDLVNAAVEKTVLAVAVVYALLLAWWWVRRGRRRRAPLLPLGAVSAAHAEPDS